MICKDSPCTFPKNMVGNGCVWKCGSDFFVFFSISPKEEKYEAGSKQAGLAGNQSPTTGRPSEKSVLAQTGRQTPFPLIEVVLPILSQRTQGQGGVCLQDQDWSWSGEIHFPGEQIWPFLGIRFRASSGTNSALSSDCYGGNRFLS